MSISPELMGEFIRKASDQLTGDWVVIGGAVLHLLNVNARQTEDIDLAGPPGATQADVIRLMEIATDFGLPIEAINQAGAFFLSRIMNWQTKLILVHKGASASFFRPNLELFFELKLGRLTEADVTDCVNYLKYTIDHGEACDPQSLISKCEALLKFPEKKDRVSSLIAVLEKLNPGS
jgi:hypothetical protein